MSGSKLQYHWQPVVKNVKGYFKCGCNRWSRLHWISRQWRSELGESWAAWRWRRGFEWWGALGRALTTDFELRIDSELQCPILAVCCFAAWLHRLRADVKWWAVDRQSIDGDWHSVQNACVIILTNNREFSQQNEIQLSWWILWPHHVVVVKWRILEVSSRKLTFKTQIARVLRLPSG